MSGRFTPAARQAVVEAQAQARTLGHREVTAEHVLLAVVAAAEDSGARVLRELGVERDALTREVAALGDADADALRAIGVDLDAVRRRAEAAFGPGAPDRPALRRTGLLRRRFVRVGGDHLPFAQPARRALEQALRQAIALRHARIGTEHLLLGLLADDQDPAARTLVRLGLSPGAVRARLHAGLHNAA